jgi:probable F420-dependent oxidoreductase
MLTSSGLRLGIAIPQSFRENRIDTGLIRDFVQRAEAAGFEDLWITENVHGGNLLEPLTLLTYAAACTSRIRVGVSVIILNLRNPVDLAKTIASLDQVSGGRLSVGFGLGDERVYPLYGVSTGRRVARFGEALTLMRSLWRESSVTMDGEFLRVRDCSIGPRPIQQPNPPVWLGGHARAALRRAVRLGDGWMGAGATRLEDFYDEIPQVREFLQESSRDPASFTLSKRIYLAVDENEKDARRRLEAGLSAMYGSAREGVGISGTPARCLAELQRIRDAGLQHLLLHPFSESLDELEVLATQISPQL